MSIDKSTRQHYAMQGKVKNYLGKQKMVKAPKYWLSKPDHVKAKLAYITDEEEKILIDKNLYGSLRGRPNIGPAGLPSLQGGDSGGLGGGGGKGGGGNRGWNPGVAAEERAKSKAASDRARANAREMAIQTAAKSTKSTKTGPSDKGDTKNPFEETGQTKKEQAKIASDVQELRDNWAFEDKKVKAPKTLTPRTRIIKQGFAHKELPLTKTLPHYYGGIGSKTTTGFGPKGDQTYSEAVEDSMKRGFFDSGIGKALKWGATLLAPQLLGPKLGQLYSGYNQAKTISKYAKNFGLTEKDIMSSLTKNLKSNISTSNLTGKKSTATDTRDDRFGQGDRGEGKQVITAPKADVVSQNIQKFSPRQMDLVRQRYDQLQQVMQTGMYNGQRLNDTQLTGLQNASKQMQAFLVDPQKTMMMARGGLAGLHG